MQSLYLKAAATAALVAAGAILSASAPASAASPGCKTSVGSSNKWTCTTDYTSNPKPAQKAQIKQIKPRFKLKTIPCYQSPVPGCE